MSNTFPNPFRVWKLQTQQKVLYWGSILGPAIAFITLIICLIITKTKNIYTGGLRWPYFSDMGRDPPAYYLFTSGLTAVCIIFHVIWMTNGYFNGLLLQQQQTESKTKISKTMQTFNYLVIVIGILSCYGLPILSIFGTAAYPSLHNYAAYWFVAMEAIATFFNTIISFCIYKVSLTSFNHSYGSFLQDSPRQPQKRAMVDNRKKLLIYQTIFLVIFWIAFILYIPVGISIVCKWRLLSVNKCLDLQYSSEYCEVTMRLNQTDTKLWDYENCIGANEVRSGAQLVVLLSLIGYVTTFCLHAVSMDYLDLDNRSERNERNEEVEEL